MLRNPLDRAVRHRDGLPVLPGAFPVLGHAVALWHDTVAVIREGRALFGPIFWVNGGFEQWMAMCASTEAFEVLRSKASSMAYLKEAVSTLVGEAILGQDGATHQRMRSAMNKPFTPRGLTAAGIGAPIAELLSERVDRWAARRSITVLDETQEVTLNVIFRLIGVEVAELGAWAEQYRRFVFSTFPFPTWIPGTPGWHAARSRAWLDEHLLAIVKEERARPNRGTFVAELAHGRDEQGQGLSDEELIDNLRLLTLAGHDTTANTMAWMTIVLARRPDLWDALCDEAGRMGELPTTPQDVKGFPFAEALFREALRLYPSVAYTSRRLLEPMTLGGRQVAAGSMVGIPLGYLSRDPEVFPDPDRFEPSRWLNRSAPLSPLETSQFGGGPHFCLGYHLAWLEAVQFALALARRMGRDGLRPRLAEGAAPHHYHLPLGHPTRGTKVDFVRW